MLEERARATIVDEVFSYASNYEDESRETGGYVFGKRSVRNNGDWLERPTQLVDLAFAAQAGEETKRSFGRVMLDLEKGRSVERSLQKRGTRERLAGNYHSHPTGDGTPSRTDLQNWSSSLEFLARDEPTPLWRLGDEIPLDCWVGIIAARSAGGDWLYPQLHAWITRRDHAGFICEPAVIRER